MVSPYFVPDESLKDAVTTACYRGVQVELYVSEKADQFMVHHAQSSYYQALLEAGVKIYQFPAPYVLHSKFVIADPDATADPASPGSHPLAMFGSSNMDMRSFGLNYESTLLVAKGDLIHDFAQLADTYRAVSHQLTLDEWNERSLARRYVDNVMRLTSALQVSTYPNSCAIVWAITGNAAAKAGNNVRCVNCASGIQDNSADSSLLRVAN